MLEPATRLASKDAAQKIGGEGSCIPKDAACLIWKDCPRHSQYSPSKDHRSQSSSQTFSMHQESVGNVG